MASVIRTLNAVHASVKETSMRIVRAAAVQMSPILYSCEAPVDARRFLATSVAAAAFGLVLLAAHCYAQTAPDTDAKTPVSSQAPATPRAVADDNAIRTFRINVPEADVI